MDDLKWNEEWCHRCGGGIYYESGGEIVECKYCNDGTVKRSVIDTIKLWSLISLHWVYCRLFPRRNDEEDFLF